MSLVIDFKPASQATIALMAKMGIPARPNLSQSEASREIYLAQGARAMAMPSKAQTGKVAAMGNGTGWIGRELPMSRFREVSLQIELLTILEKLDLATSQHGINTAAAELIEAVRQRLSKPRKGAAFNDKVEAAPEQPAPEGAEYF